MKVLLFEPNYSHNEILPGFVYYFQQLGYTPIVIRNKSCKNEDIFSRFSNHNIKIYNLNFLTMYLLGKTKVLNKFKYTIVTSAVHYDILEQLNHTIKPCSSLKLFQISPMPNVITIKHDTTDPSASPLHAMLWNFNNERMINPHYFGTIPPHELKEQCLNFIVVGGITNERKNHQLLLESLEYIDQTQASQKVKFTIIGRGHLSNDFNKYKHLINFKGKVGFAELYTEMQNADYFLPLLDPENIFHRRYITSGVTGSIQLILGFTIPPIIQENFADFYKFNPSNSIVYSRDLKEGINRALNLNKAQYLCLKQNLKYMSNKIKARSLQNLRELLQ